MSANARIRRRLIDELVPSVAAMIDDIVVRFEDPPPHNTMNARHRPIFDHARKSRAVFVFEQRRLAWRLAINEAHLGHGR
jgi:hypothetical protein